MPRRKRRTNTRRNKDVETIRHADATRRNLPSAEHQALMDDDEQSPIQIAYERRNRDLDPQLVWRGKDLQDASDLVVQAPPLYIQERVHPKALIDDLLRQSQANRDAESDAVQEGFADLFADFNGLPDENAKTEFYQHDANWSNRMILGDSLQVMSSLAEREGLRGKVQCIYLDPPYGIRFNSNFQWSTRSLDVRDGRREHITREPEQVKAFRDTWRDGIHSYLHYLRERLDVARELLYERGSIFVQIGDENVHRVRALMDEVFGDDNFISQITYKVTSGFERAIGPRRIQAYIIWYAKDRGHCKFHRVFRGKHLENLDLRLYRYVEQNGEFRPMTTEERNGTRPPPAGARIFRSLPLHTMGTEKREPRTFNGEQFTPPANTQWRHTATLYDAIVKSDRVIKEGNRIRSKLFLDDFNAEEYNNVWIDTGPELSKFFVVQTSAKVIQRCILMTTDPGDLVLDPTCGSGTTAYVAEQWGRRWITIDTSRVALALARARIMGARYPYYLLADSEDGREKEAEVTRKDYVSSPTYGDIRQGFVYERVPHITLRDIANNAEIDVIYDEFQQQMEPVRAKLNEELGQNWEEWEIPRDISTHVPPPPTKLAIELHAKWWELRIARQKEIDASIAAKAEFEYLYDKPYEDRRKVRVAGPFTVESVTPHRMLSVDENGEFVDHLEDSGKEFGQDFAQRMLEQLKTAGIQQSSKDDKINFDSVVGFPGQKMICAEGFYTEGDEDSGVRRRAGIHIGPEFGTVSRADLVSAAREAAEIGFDVLIACAFNYEGHTTELEQLGRIPVLKARMNADLHMATDLKNTGKGNLFVIFGEPDVDLRRTDDDQIVVEVKGIDVFDPQSGQVRSDDTDGIACWFVDTDYNGESFFVRQAYFLGAQDPYKSLKTTLRAEIDADAWATLNSSVSRPFDAPSNGRIAVKIINHLGDEAMKVFQV